MNDHSRQFRTRHACRRLTLLSILLPLNLLPASSSDGDIPLSAVFYADASCLVTLNHTAETGTTVIDADFNSEANESRMLIHCDTQNNRRLTLLARGDSLSQEQRIPLLNHTQITADDKGMIVWLTHSGVHYTDDSVPRHYVFNGSVKLRKMPPVDVVSSGLNQQLKAFVDIMGFIDSNEGSISVLDLPGRTQDADKESQNTQSPDSSTITVRQANN